MKMTGKKSNYVSIVKLRNEQIEQKLLELKITNCPATTGIQELFQAFWIFLNKKNRCDCRQISRQISWNVPANSSLEMRQLEWNGSENNDAELWAFRNIKYQVYA